MAKQICRVEPIHTTAGFMAKMKHNYRIGNVPNADKDKMYENRQVIKLPVGETYSTFYERKIAESSYYETHQVRKNAVLGYEIMLSFGSDNLPKDFSLDKWQEQSRRFLLDYFGVDNVASAVLHMDEEMPHIHAVIVPMKDGKLNGSAFIGDRDGMRKMHDEYNKYVKECGLERGSNYMNIEHEKVRKFYGNLNKAIEKDLPGPNEGEDIMSYAKRANEFYKDQALRDFGRDVQIKNLKKEKKALEKANKALYEKIQKEEIKYQKLEEKSKEAIKYRENLKNAFDWALKKDKETTEKIIEVVGNVQNSYAREVLSKNKEK